MARQEQLRDEPEGGEDDQEGLPMPEDNDIVRGKVRKAFAALEKIDKDREALNAKANEIRAGIKNLGIPIPAFNAAYARSKMDEDKRVTMDAAFAICCNAKGIQFQQGLFDHKEEGK